MPPGCFTLSQVRSSQGAPRRLKMRPLLLLWFGKCPSASFQALLHRTEVTAMGKRTVY